MWKGIQTTNLWYYITYIMQTNGALALSSRLWKALCGVAQTQHPFLQDTLRSVFCVLLPACSQHALKTCSFSQHQD